MLGLVVGDQQHADRFGIEIENRAADQIAVGIACRRRIARRTVLVDYQWRLVVGHIVINVAQLGFNNRTRAVLAVQKLGTSAPVFLDDESTE